MHANAPDEDGHKIGRRWLWLTAVGLVVGGLISGWFIFRSREPRLQAGATHILAKWLLDPVPDGAVLFIGQRDSY